MRKYWNNMRKEGEEKLKIPDYHEEETRKIKDDKRAYADDLILNATETKQIYGKLESFAKAGNYHEIGINWGKIAILTKALDREIRELKKIMPGRYRGIQFVKEATLLGQRIDLGKNGKKSRKR